VHPPGDFNVPDTALSCGDLGCSDLGRAHGMAAQASCLRGKIAKTATPVEVAASFAGADPLHRLQSGTAFCIDTIAPTQVMFAATNLDCGPVRKIPPAAAPATCAEDSCVELGTVTCKP